MFTYYTIHPNVENYVEVDSKDWGRVSGVSLDCFRHGHNPNRGGVCPCNPKYPSRPSSYVSNPHGQGEALIRAVEAGTRTGAGMMGMMRWGGPQVQRLLEETAQLSDVLYMTVISPEGRILAHSDAGQIGHPFRASASLSPSEN